MEAMKACCDAFVAFSDKETFNTNEHCEKPVKSHEYGYHRLAAAFIAAFGGTKNISIESFAAKMSDKLKQYLRSRCCLLILIYVSDKYSLFILRDIQAGFQLISFHCVKYHIILFLFSDIQNRLTLINKSV